MAADIDPGVARTGLAVVFWAWLVETALSALLRVAVGAMQGGRWLGLVGAGSSIFFVLFAAALATGAFLVARAARGSATRATCVAAGALYALHAALILGQLLLPAALGAGGTERYLQVAGILGAGLAIVRLAAWGALALGIQAVSVEEGRPPPNALRLATTVAYALAVAVAVVGIAFARRDEGWQLAASLIGLAANVVFLVYVRSALRAAPRAVAVASSPAREAGALRLYGSGVIVRAVLVFLALGVGASGGLLGLTLVALIALPAVLLVGDMVPLAGMALVARARRETLATAALLLGIAGLVADGITAWGVLGAISRARGGTGPEAPAVGGIALACGLVATCLFVLVQKRMAAERNAPGLARLATAVFSGEVVAGLAGAAALVLLSRGPTGPAGLAALALAGLAAFAATIGLVVLSFSLARAARAP